MIRTCKIEKCPQLHSYALLGQNLFGTLSIAIQMELWKQAEEYPNVVTCINLLTVLEYHLHWFTWNLKLQQCLQLRVSLWEHID